MHSINITQHLPGDLGTEVNLGDHRGSLDKVRHVLGSEGPGVPTMSCHLSVSRASGTRLLFSKVLFFNNLLERMSYSIQSASVGMAKKCEIYLLFPKRSSVGGWGQGGQGGV